jgi:hypothetical protein
MKRWKKIDSGITITSVGIIATTSIAAGIAGTLAAPFFIPIFLPAAPAILGTLSALETVVFSGIKMGLTSKKKKKFDNKCKLVQSYLDKIFYYIEQCKQDSIITLDEIKGFESLMNDFRNEIEQISKLHDEQYTGWANKKWNICNSQFSISLFICYTSPILMRFFALERGCNVV